VSRSSADKPRSTRSPRRPNFVSRFAPGNTAITSYEEVEAGGRVARRTRIRRSVRQAPSLGDRARAFLPLRSWRLQLVGAAVGIVVAVLSAQSFASAREGATTYLIQPGDTLSAISSTTGIPVDKLATLNGIKDPNIIIAGQTLSLTTSGSGAAPAASGPGSYTVKAGDTLWDISQSNGVKVDDLVQLNGLGNADVLAVGQVLRLPVTAGAIQRTAGIATPTPAAPKAKPTPSPTATPAVSKLQQKVAAEASRVAANAHVGVAALNLVSGEKLAWHADDQFPSASVMKLPLLVELERQVAAGNVSWTESLRAEVSAMIAISDNTAANEVASVVHPAAVNDTMASLGLSGTHFVNLFNDARSSTNPGENATTPSNMARLLQLIATDQIVSPQVSGDIRALMARNADRSKLVRLLPPDAQVSHKSGWYDGVANDVGIVTVDRVPTRWVIAVFSENDPDAEAGNQLVAAISRAVYDAWAP
jgi:beta-lactamase class A